MASGHLEAPLNSPAYSHRFPIEQLIRYRVAAWRRQNTTNVLLFQHAGLRACCLEPATAVTQLNEAVGRALGHQIGEDLSPDTMMRKRMAARTSLWEEYTGLEVGSDAFQDAIDQTAAALLR